MKQIVLVIGCIISFSLLSGSLEGQDPGHGSPYSTPILSNPALTGAHRDGLLTLSYRDFFPGQNFGIGSLYMSYDSWLEPVHGGIGGFVMENRLGGLLNDFRSGLTYSYHLRATRDIYINAGFMASVINRNINRTDIIFPDQIDVLLGPIFPSAEVPDIGSRTVFDAGVGFLISWLEWHAGISFGHVAVPDLSFSGNGEGRIGRKYLIHAGTRFKFGDGMAALAPLVAASVQDGIFTFGTDLVAEYKVVALNLGGTVMNEGISSIRAGISIDFERFSLRYNYYFSGNRIKGFTPMTLSNQVGLVFSLNNVDKSKVLNAINYPKL